MPQKCVLVVDDDADSRMICRELLTHHGYCVIEADNGADGIKQAIETCPDLVIVDLRLPGIDGMDVVRTLRAANPTTDTPILLYTADAIRSRQYLEAEEIAGLLIKPCPTARIVHEVERLIGQARLDGDRRSQLR
jgi:twitching motility two-component system response regulator PilH